ncbi:hypothetical protein HHI36_002695 [Cryptolaemus montrouzieri]|uniref:Uncharacterized protein n=1 Tax=Cryptolaemus montrouzieri TaxID=559131 RepID=A0ABD2PC69_9CUCU
MLEHLKSKFPYIRSHVDKLPERENANSSSLKVGADLDLMEELNKSENWPINMTIRRFKFFDGVEAQPNSETWNTAPTQSTRKNHGNKSGSTEELIFYIRTSSQLKNVVLSWRISWKTRNMTDLL